MTPFLRGHGSGGEGTASATRLAIGAGQILYGVLAFVILIVKGAEFSRPLA